MGDKDIRLGHCQSAGPIDISPGHSAAGQTGQAVCAKPQGACNGFDLWQLRQSSFLQLLVEHFAHTAPFIRPADDFTKQGGNGEHNQALAKERFLFGQDGNGVGGDELF